MLTELVLLGKKKELFNIDALISTCERCFLGLDAKHFPHFHEAHIRQSNALILAGNCFLRCDGNVGKSFRAECGI